MAMNPAQLTRDQWQAALEALGPEKAEAWRQRNGIYIEGEELPPVDEEPAPGLGMDPGDPNTSIAEPAGALGGNDQMGALYGDLMSAQERARTSRMQLLQQATEALQNRRMGPSTSEKLYAISAALLSPTRTRGFSGMMGNLLPVMRQISTADREGEQQKSDALLQLRQKYTEAGIDDEQEGIKTRIAALKAQNVGARPRVSWSESLGRAINLDTPEVIGTGVLGGQQVYKYSDGTLRMPGADGTYKVYDAGGRRVGLVDAQGNPVNGRP